MDGTKRKARPWSQPSAVPFPVDYLGATPPWSLPASFYQESALRSTQNSSSHTVDPSCLHQHAAPLSATLPQRPALSTPGGIKRPAQTRGNREDPAFGQCREGTARIESDNAACVDTDENGVYIINCAEGSWSGPLDSEDDLAVQATLPAEALAFVQRFQRVREREEECTQSNTQDYAKQALCLTAANDDVEALIKEKTTTHLATEAEEKWKTDLLLRNVVRQIKKKLNNGASLTLERLGPINLTLSCAHPLCPAFNALIPPGAYYLILSGKHSNGDNSRYCLFCLEGLWNGKGITGKLSHLDIDLSDACSRPKVSSFSLDGAMDAARLQAADASANAASATLTPPWSTPHSHSQSHNLVTPPPSKNLGHEGSVSTHPVDRDQRSARLGHSPLLRKTQLATPRPEYAADGGLEPGAGCRKTRTPALRSLKVNIPDGNVRLVRRSARLNSADSSSSLTMSASSVSPALVKDEDTATADRKMASSDAIVDKIGKAETRLKALYGKRREALSELGFGQKVSLKSSGSRNVAGCIVSKDVFGVVCTDLLADHVKYRAKQSKADRYRRLDSLAFQTRRRSANGKQEAKLAQLAAEERWCLCYGLEDGRVMIECRNEKCLVRWYHADCIGVDPANEEDWLCHLCAPQSSRLSLMPILTIDTEVLRRLFDPPHANEKTYNVRQAIMSPCPAGGLVDSIAQLDGPTDLSHQSQKPSPLSQTHFVIPDCFMSSKHAPQDDELALYEYPEQVEQGTPSSPPLAPLCQTPGSVRSEEDSTTSTGEWRHQMTGSQYLANFIKAGNSLNAKEKAAVELWKAASEEQLAWNRFRNKYEQNVRDLANPGTSDDTTPDALVDYVQQQDDDCLKVGSLEEGEIAESFGERSQCSEASHQPSTDYVENKLERLESQTGISKKDCRGKDLTTVLVDPLSR